MHGAGWLLCEEEDGRMKSLQLLLLDSQWDMLYLNTRKTFYCGDQAAYLYL